MRGFALVCCSLMSLLTSDAAQTTCKLSDANLNDCVKKALQENLPSLHNPSGNKDFPQADPFFFEFGEIHLNRLKTVQGTFTVTNMTIIGGKSMKFEEVSVRSNATNMEVKAKISMPQSEASGWYKSNLTISTLAFASKGVFKNLFKGITAEMTVSGSLIENGKKFDVTSFEMVPTVKNLKFNLMRSPANENLDRVVNQFINESWKPVYRDLVDEAKPTWGPIAVSLMKELFGFIDFSP